VPKKRLLVGLDPGGKSAFGWAVLEDAPGPPLRLLASGVADRANEAVAEVQRHLKGGRILAVGIDAPLYWTFSGDRNADRRLRRRVQECGGPSGTVQHLNSLRGACLVQGIVAAMLLRKQNPTLPLSESHPKAMLWLHEEVLQWIDGSTQASDEHERDAALGALSAWALLHRPFGWRDLALWDEDRIGPLFPSPAYWMPWKGV